MDTAAPPNPLPEAEPTRPVPAAGLSGGKMASAALVVMLFFVASRVTGLFREMIIGAQFGTSADLDAYLAAFRLPDLLFQLIAGGALGSAFIPVFTGYLGREDRAGAWLLFSRVLNLMTLLLVALAGLGALFAVPLVRYVIAPGFSAAQQELTAGLMRWMLVGSVIFGASGLVMGALNALQHFLLPAAAPVIYNLAIILGAWLLAPYIGIYGLVAGVMAGSLGHLLVQLPGLARRQARYTLDWTLRDPGVLEVARLMGPRVLGLFFVQLHFLVNTILASGLSSGSLSALNYAWLLMLLPLGVFAQAIGTASFPTLAAQIAAGQRDAMRATFGQLLRMVFFLTIPAAAGLYLLREPIIRLLFERGQFGSDSTQMVGYALQFYAVGLAAHAAVEIAVRAFYALHNTWTPVAVGVAAMLLNIGLSLLLVGPLSFGGLALANTTATTLEMAALLWLLHRKMGGLQARRLGATVMRSLAATAIMAGALGIWLEMLAEPWARASIAALGGIALAGLVYLGTSALLRSEELRPALRLVAARRGRRA